jgi:hypothetical protein
MPALPGSRIWLAVWRPRSRHLLPPAAITSHDLRARTSFGPPAPRMMRTHVLYCLWQSGHGSSAPALHRARLRTPPAEKAAPHVLTRLQRPPGVGSAARGACVHRSGPSHTPTAYSVATCGMPGRSLRAAVSPRLAGRGTECEIQQSPRHATRIRTYDPPPPSARPAAASTPARMPVAFCGMPGRQLHLQHRTLPSPDACPGSSAPGWERGRG